VAAARNVQLVRTLTYALFEAFPVARISVHWTGTCKSAIGPLGAWPLMLWPQLPTSRVVRRSRRLTEQVIASHEAQDHKLESPQQLCGGVLPSYCTAVS
jgi:hypothetical protein